MKFGIGFPTAREGHTFPAPFCDPDDLVRIARRAEELGFYSLGGNDHIISQEYVDEMWEASPRYYEVFNTLSYVAAKTTEIVLNVTVAVLPIRNPVWIAKQSSTIDYLTDGRLLLGVGVGAYREEYEAMHPDRASAPRGKITDESVEALSGLFDPGPTSYNGEFVTFEDVELHPRPAQEEFPIYIGGNHPNAIERTVKWGHGWIPVGGTVEELTERREELRAVCEEHDRDPDTIDVAPQFIVAIAEEEDEARERFRNSQAFAHLKSLSKSTMDGIDIEEFETRNLIGTPEEITARLGAYRDIRIDHYPGAIIAANSLESLDEQMALLSDEVFPHFD